MERLNYNRLIDFHRHLTPEYGDSNPGQPVMRHEHYHDASLKTPIAFQLENEVKMRNLFSLVDVVAAEQEEVDHGRKKLLEPIWKIESFSDYEPDQNSGMLEKEVRFSALSNFLKEKLDVAEIYRQRTA